MDAAQVRQLVEQRLQEAQQSKVYKDFGRVSGTAKERRALGLITVTVVEEQERSLEELADLVKKDKVLPKFDPDVERQNGNSSAAAYFRYQVFRAWIPKPVVKHRDLFRLYVDALTQFNSMTQENTTLELAVSSFRALFNLSQYAGAIGTIADKMGALDAIQAKDWTRYSMVSDEYKGRIQREAVFSAIMGKQLMKRAASSGIDWYNEAKAFEPVTLEQAAEQRENIRNKYAELITDIDTRRQQAKDAADVSALVATNTRMNLLLGEYTKQLKKSPEDFNSIKLLWVEYFDRRLSEQDRFLEKAVNDVEARDADWTWTEKYFGRTTQTKRDPNAIRVNTYPYLNRLTRKNALATSELVQPAELATTWGLKAVQYGNSLNDKDSERLTFWANCSFVDLGEIIKLDMSAINRRMGLGVDLATRGISGSVAHYQPAYAIINMNRNGADGSFAHEWGHALDHWMGKRLFGEGFLSDTVMNTKVELRPSEQALRGIMQYTIRSVHRAQVTVEAAKVQRYRLPAIDLDQSAVDTFTEIVQSWSKRYRMGTRELKELAADVAKAYDVPSITVTIPRTGSDQYHGSVDAGGGYWIKFVELFARSFEGFVMKRLDQLDMRSDYLQASRKWAGAVYPSERDMDALFPLFQELFAELAEEEDAAFDILKLPVLGTGLTRERVSFDRVSDIPTKKESGKAGVEQAQDQEQEAQEHAPEAVIVLQTVEEISDSVVVDDPVPDSAPIPKPKSQGNKRENFKEVVQSVADTLNAAIETRQAEKPETHVAATYRFEVGSLATEPAYFGKAGRNVEAVHVLTYGPHPIYLHRDFHGDNRMGKQEPDPNAVEAKRYTLSSYGVTYGVEHVAGKVSTDTRNNTMEVMRSKTGEILSSWTAEAFNGTLEKAKAELEGTTATGSAWKVVRYDSRQLEKKRGVGDADLQNEATGQSIRLTFSKRNGEITCQCRSFNAKGFRMVELSSNHPLELFRPTNSKYVDELLTELPGAILGLDPKGQPIITDAFWKKWGPQPLLLPWNAGKADRPKYSPGALGFGPSSQRWLNREEGVTVETDATVLIKNGGDITPRIKHRSELRGAVTQRMIESVMSGLQDRSEMRLMKAVGVRGDHHYRSIGKVVFFVDAQYGVNPVAIYREHYDLFANLYGDDIAIYSKGKEGMRPLSVFKNGQFMGLIMPVVLRDEYAWENAAMEVGQGLKTLEQIARMVPDAPKLDSQASEPGTEQPEPAAPEPVVAMPVVPNVPEALDDDPNWSPEYYQDVRDQVERLGDMTTSDAQGVISAYVLRQRRAGGVQDYEGWQGYGYSGEYAARLILGMDPEATDAPAPEAPAPVAEPDPWTYELRENKAEPAKRRWGFIVRLNGEVVVGDDSYRTEGAAKNAALRDIAERKAAGLQPEDKPPAHVYELGDGWRENFDYDGMNAWLLKADAGTLSLDELRSLYDSLDSLDGGKYRAEASRVYAMIMDLEEPKLTDQEQQELDAQTKLEAMFYGDPSSIIPVATLPEPGQLVAMGLDAVEAKPSRIVLARPGARQGIAVLAGRARDLYEAVPRMVGIGGYSPGYYVNRDNRPVMQFIAARWDEGIILNTWEVEERTQWPTITEAIASVYASGGTLDIFAQELDEMAALPAEEIKARKRPEGKPPSPQQWRKVKAKLKGMARQADGEDMESLRETAQRIQALRGYYGQVDEASRNKRTRPLTKKTLISWAKAPGRMDLEGIDTPR